MSKETLQEFAKQLNLPEKELLQKFKEIGIALESGNDIVSDEHKKQLMQQLQANHNDAAPAKKRNAKKLPKNQDAKDGGCLLQLERNKDLVSSNKLSRSLQNNNPKPFFFFFTTRFTALAAFSWTLEFSCLIFHRGEGWYHDNSVFH